MIRSWDKMVYTKFFTVSKKLILLSLAVCYFPMSWDIVSSPLRTFAFQFGMGWSVFFLAMTTKPNKTSLIFKPLWSFQAQEAYDWLLSIKPIGLLVSVSFIRYRTSTSDLSTWSSSTALIGRTCFEASFPLRCFQRLSLPGYGYSASQLASRPIH